MHETIATVVWCVCQSVCRSDTFLRPAKRLNGSTSVSRRRFLEHCKKRKRENRTLDTAPPSEETTKSTKYKIISYKHLKTLEKSGKVDLVD